MQTPTREQFTQQVIDLIRRRFPLAKIARGDEPFSLRLNGLVASLENLYRQIVHRPDDLEQQVSRWAVELLHVAEGSPDRDAGFDELKSRVMPYVLADEIADGLGSSMVTQPLIHGLAVGYVIDAERTITHISAQQVKRWNVSMEALHEVALDNLVERSQELAADAAQDEDGTVNLVLFQTRDGYAASRILLPALHERLRGHLASPFIAAIPNRDILICIRNDETILSNVREQIRSDFQTMPHSVTDRLFLVTADGLAPHDGR